MNNRITELQMGINDIILQNKFDVTQGDKNTHFIKISFNEEIDLVGWTLIAYFKTMYPVEVFVDTYSNLTQIMEIAIPTNALLRNGKLQVEFGLKKDDQLITINKFLELNVLKTINGAYLNANLGNNTQNNIAEALGKIQKLVDNANNKIEEYNLNAKNKTDEFNSNATKQGEDYVHAVKTEGDTWVIAVQNEGDIQYKRVNESGSTNIQNLNTEYNNKIKNLDTTITNYIVTNSDKFKGEKGEPGQNGQNAIISNVIASVNNTVGTPNVQVQMGGTENNRTFNFSFENLKGDRGENGLPGTTDYNQLQNKPTLDFYKQNSTIQTNKSDLAIQLKSNNNQAQYEEWTKNNVRKIIFGFESGTNNDKFVFNGYNNTFLELNGFSYLQAKLPYITIGTKLRMSSGDANVFITPENDIAKTLKFYDIGIGNNCYLDLDFGGKSTIMGLKEPTGPQQPTTKKYVDDELNKLLKRIEALEQKK